MLLDVAVADALSKQSGWEGAADSPWTYYGKAGLAWRPTLREYCERCTNSYSQHLLMEGFDLPQEAFARLLFQSFRTVSARDQAQGRVWVARCQSCQRIHWIKCVEDEGDRLSRELSSAATPNDSGIPDSM